MARSSSRPSQFERGYRILEYLRWNSDRTHPVTQAGMRRNEELGSYLGGKEAFRDLILSMVSAMNFGDYGLRPQHLPPACAGRGNQGGCGRSDSSRIYAGRFFHDHEIYHYDTGMNKGFSASPIILPNFCGIKFWKALIFWNAHALINM